MANFLARIRSQMREREHAQLIQAISINERPILAYAEDDYTWNQLGPYVDVVMAEHRRPVVYVTSDPQDPRFTDHDELMSVFFIRDSRATFIPRVDSPVFLTTMPDLGSFHIKRPKVAQCVYAFHSLNSTHMAYRPGAFDAYDVFFCTGPYQMEELAKHFDQVGKTEYDLREVGYPKLDGIAATFGTYQKRYPNETTILIAPSWGEDNVLSVDGAGLVDALLGAGYRVVVRPHPAFFESIYPEGRQIVSDLEARFAGRSKVDIETSITSEDSFMEADLMISDWSGAAFEYAMGTERPVLFIDLPPKTNNPEWAQLGIIPFEDRMRREVGSVIEPGDPTAAVSAVRALLANASGYRVRLVELRSRSIYNFGSAAKIGAAVLDELAE